MYFVSEMCKYALRISLYLYISYNKREKRKKNKTDNTDNKRKDIKGKELFV